MRWLLERLMAMLRAHPGDLAEEFDAAPDLTHRRFPELDFGSTGARRLLLEGGTLLHVAAEFGNVEASRLLLARGASPNAVGGSGQTPIFHSVSQFRDWGLEVTRLLIEAGADLSIRVKLPGRYEQSDHFPECTPLGYALQFPAGDWPNGANPKTIELLRAHGAPQ
jgi:ankyrin repeat protein